MKTTDRPDDGDLCGRERCGHEFGMHYISYDRKIVGCGWSMDDQRDGFKTRRSRATARRPSIFRIFGIL
jgi:hypothetical protein